MLTADEQLEILVALGTSAEMQLAHQDPEDLAPGSGPPRPDRSRARGNPPTDLGEMDRGREKLERISGN